MSAHCNGLSAGNTIGNKENMCKIVVQSGKVACVEDKITCSKKKGLSYNAEYIASHTTSEQKSPGKARFYIYCEDDGEIDRSRSRVRKIMCKKATATKRDIKERQKIASTTQVLEQEKATNPILLPAASRRTRSSSNSRKRTSFDQNNWMRRISTQRSVSESRGTTSLSPITRYFSTVSANLPLSKTKHLTDDVKKRTLSSIQLWKEKMRKSCTGTVPKNFTAVQPNNLNVDATYIKSKLRKSCDIDVIKILHGGSSDFPHEVVQNRKINQNKNINELVHEVSSSKIATEHLPGKFNINASTKLPFNNVREKQLDDSIEVVSSSKTPLYDFFVLPLTPMKVRYEKRGLTHIRSAIKEYDLDGVIQIPYECDYLQDLPDTERKREENAPKLSSRFLRENVNAKQRKLIVGYLHRLGLHCHYSSYIIYQSVKLFDIAIDRIWVETNNIQLMALTCLWTTLKLKANADKIPSATTMIQLAKDMYIGQEKYLVTYEKKVLSAVKFNIQFADPFSLLLYYILKANKDFKISSSNIKHIYFCGSYLIDVSMLEESLCDTSVFVLVIAAIELSLYFIYPHDFSIDGTSCKFWRHRKLLEEWEERAMKSTKQIMIRQVLEYDRFGSNVIYKKYLRSQHGRVSNFLLDKAKKVLVKEMLQKC